MFSVCLRREASDSKSSSVEEARAGVTGGGLCATDCTGCEGSAVVVGAGAGAGAGALDSVVWAVFVAVAGDGALLCVLEPDCPFCWQPTSTRVNKQTIIPRFAFVMGFITCFSRC